MKHQHTDITIVLDRSGSMRGVARDTIGGFNKFLEDQQKAPGSASLTLNQFDHDFEVVLASVPIKEADPLSDRTFVPRGNTALLDAIGRSIVSTGERLEKTSEADRPEKVVFVILTDGEENASREYTRDRINEMISHQTDKYQWQFVFLGANQDAIQTGAAIGIPAACAMTYAANSMGTDLAFSAVSSNLVQMRTGRSHSMAYTEEQRKAQKAAGAKP